MKTFVVNKDGSTQIQEIPKPRYSAKQALVKTIACGMCGTDVKLLHQQFKGFPADIYPIMLGHEGVGEVVEVGSEVTTFKPGDRVILPFVDPDPELYPGLNSGWGALSEYAVVCDPAAWPEGEAPECAYAQQVLPDDIDPVDAVMIVTFREVLASIRYFGIKPGDKVVVYGCGPVGSTFIKFMNLYGVEEITAVDIIDEKLETVLANGARYAINSQKTDVAKEVRSRYPEGVDYVLDAIGAPFVLNAAMPLIKDRGCVLCYGVPPVEQVTIDFSKADYNWSVIYQQMPRKAEEGLAHEQVMEWISSGKIALKDFISDYFKFEDSVYAFSQLLERKIQKKGIIVF